MALNRRLSRVLNPLLPRERGHARLQRILVEEPTLPVYHCEKPGESALHVAIERNAEWALPILMEKVAPAARKAVSDALVDHAVRKGNVAAGRWLCQHGAHLDPHAVRIAMTAPVHRVRELLDWMKEEGVAMDPSYTGPLLPALHLAILHHRQHCPAVVQAALEHGLTLEHQTLDDGTTPLHAAAHFGGLSVELWEHLLDAGASIQARDREGRTPVDVLRHHPRDAFPSDAQGLRTRIESLLLNRQLASEMKTTGRRDNRSRM